MIESKKGDEKVKKNRRQEDRNQGGCGGDVRERSRNKGLLKQEKGKMGGVNRREGKVTSRKVRLRKVIVREKGGRG